MAVWNVVRKRQLWSRIDLAAEHYHPDKISMLELLGHSRGASLGSIVESVREIVKSPPEGVAVFDTNAASMHILTEESAQGEERISAKKIGRSGDIVISRLRSYLRQVAWIPETIDLAYLTTEFIVLRSTADDPIAYLLPFLLSRPVQTVLHWSQDGSEHPRFKEEVLLSLNVPSSIFSHANRLNDLVRDAARELRRSFDLYSQAESLLLTELGLDKLDLSPSLFFEARYSDTVKASRMDAEYFSPRMQNLMSKLGGDDLVLGDVAALAKRKFRPQPGVDFRYIEIGDIVSPGRAHSKIVAGEDAPTRAAWIVRENDVITTTVRPIRRLSALITGEQDGSVCSSGFAVLEPKNIEPEFLLVFLRLPIVCELLDLYTTASMYPAISVVDLMKLPILLPNNKVRNAIAKKVRGSFAAQEESKRLINEAVRRVEEVILGRGR